MHAEIGNEVSFQDFGLPTDEMKYSKIVVTDEACPCAPLVVARCTEKAFSTLIVCLFPTEKAFSTLIVPYRKSFLHFDSLLVPY